jgi:hypothetical protein
VASALEDVSGLESYVAIPIYRTIPLEHYLRNEQDSNARLSNNAALVVNYVLLDGMTPPSAQNADTLPVAFTRHLPTIAQALFVGARSNPSWQYAVAVHRLGVFLGHYWSAIAKGTLLDGRIIDPVYQCLPMMNDVERWMDGPGRDALLRSLDTLDGNVPAAAIKVLGELRDPRAIAPIIQHIEGIKTLSDRSEALTVGALCDVLGQLGDRRAVTPLLQLLNHTVNTTRRASVPKRQDNLPTGDADIPGSIVYAAIVRATGNLGDISALGNVLQATHDLDPYVRTQAFEAIKRLDPGGEDPRSRAAAHEGLSDPRDSVIRSACQLIIQYRDQDAIPALQRLMEVRPELSYLAQDALHQIRR